ETLRTGVGFVHFVCHGNANGCIVTSQEVYNLTNEQKYIIANAMTSDCGAFENNDCFVENFINALNGGAICGFFNSSYGLGYSNGPAGPSKQIDIEFYRYFFTHDSLFEIGKCHSASKHNFCNSAISQGVWRWCYYETNLFGDPELPMWGLKPCTLVVTPPNTIRLGPQNYLVTVRSAGNPLANVLVCLWKGDEVYARSKTDISGNVTLSINPTTTGPMLITVTAKNHLPYESSCMAGIEEKKISTRLIQEIKIVTNSVRDKLVIRYSLPVREKIKAEVFDVCGRFAGLDEIVWRPKNLAPGVYFIKISSTYAVDRYLSFIFL
ncbi:MAG: C25 family cysteine peptidase, partial [candidate division WOR-3 bacterium]